MINAFNKNRRLYPVPIKSPPISTKPIVIPAPTISTDKTINKPIWPDGGINIPNGTAQKPEQIDNESDDDDQNNWGGIDAKPFLEQADADELKELHDAEMKKSPLKYGPGNYPGTNSDNYRTSEFYNGIFAENNKHFTWIIPNVLAGGPHPIYSSHETDLSALKKAGFKAIVSVYDKCLEPKYIDSFLSPGSEYLFLSTAEGSICDLNEVCRFIEAQESKCNPVFVHSFNGDGRAATVLAAYLIYKSYLTAEEAIEYIRQHFDKLSIGTKIQQDALSRF